MAWIAPKLDWTKDDFYNFEDLDRIENNTEVIAEIMVALGHPAPLSPIVKNRDIKRIEFADSLNRIESNINVLGQPYKPNGWQDPKLDWQANTAFNYSDAIRLESNLALLYFYYKGNYDAIPVCGMMYCGEEVV